MPRLVRALLSILPLAVVAICAFGFLATFEPLAPKIQWTWRVIYGAIGAVALLVAVWLLVGGLRKSRP